MVQVDVFWSYGIGASMALAAGRQLRARRELARSEPPEAAALDRLPGDPPDRASLRRNPFLLATVLYAALLFAPSGAYLLWEFPDWETMHAASTDIASWLVVLFAITNVAQAMLGFWVVERLMVRGRAYAAYLQVVAAYLGMFFILVHGWDGEGYRRFFSPDRADYLAWNGDWSAWLTSDVALTLLAMGAILIPALLATVARWTLAGYALAPAAAPRPGAAAVISVHLATVFGAGLGVAILASVLIHALGPPGVPAAAALVGLALVPGGPVHRLFSALGLREPGPGAPAPARAVSTLGRAPAARFPPTGRWCSDAPGAIILIVTNARENQPSPGKPPSPTGGWKRAERSEVGGAGSFPDLAVLDP